MPEEGIASLADAFESAASELGEAMPSVEATTLPVVDSDDTSTENTADVEPVDNPDEAQEQEGLDLEGFEDLFAGDSEESSVDVDSPEFLETKVTVDTVAGPETVSIAEMRKGYLRQADYTQKTQEVAEQRRAASRAVEFYEAFNKDPKLFAQELAERAGFIEPGAEPVRNIEVAAIPTPETVEEMVEQRVQERIASDPAIQEARLETARRQVRQTFDGIESKHKTQLNDDQRRAVIAEANRRGTTDLELVFEAMLSRYRSEKPRRPAASSRPTSSASGEKPAAPLLPKSVEEALRMAEADLAEVM